MTLAKAAEVLGLDRNYLRVAVNRGALKATKLGRDWLVEDSEVERYRLENLGKIGKRKPKPTP